MASTIYVIAGSDDRTWHYLMPRDYDRGSPTGVTWEADGQPMTHTRDHWYTYPGLASIVVATRNGPSRADCWRINDPAAISKRFPARLTTEEYDARNDDEDVLAGLYSAVYEPGDEERFTFPRETFVDLGVGDPAPKDGLTWQADLPWDLEKHPEVKHLFSGRLIGFRAALQEYLEQIPGVKVYTMSGFEVYAKVGYEPPQHSWQGNILRSGRRSQSRGQRVEKTLTRHERYSVPNDVPGVNRAAAVERWNAAMGEWVAAITEMATVRVCSVCDGTGVAR